MSRRRLIVVSNRAPVSYGRTAEGEREARRGGGGLVTALASLVSEHDVTWIASAMSDEDRAVAAEAGGSFEETARDGSRYRLRLLAHDPAAYERYYNVVANPTLWFAQHYLWRFGDEPDLDATFHAAWEEGYVVVNRSFAEAVCAELEDDPGALVFFHDYHLYLAPRLVRERAPGATLSHFVHIPWPQPDYWSVLPEPLRRAVHEGLLANDIVGFHTRRWRDNFLRCCAEFLGAEIDVEPGRVRLDEVVTSVRFSPVSVDPEEFAGLAESEAVRAAEAELVAERPEQLVLRVDRTDPSKNVVRGFRAFGLLLERHPELHGRVTMLALLDPSRQDIPVYRAYLAAIEEAVREVNERFETAGWTPVVLRVADDFAASIAAYKQFDVLLVNAVFDGLNLVAKEAPLVNVRDGVVVLSENAGAHEELGEWVLTVNPFDVEGQAEALYSALRLAEPERRRRLQAIQAHVRLHDVSRWIEGELAAMDEAPGRAGRTLSGQ